MVASQATAVRRRSHVGEQAAANEGRAGIGERQAKDGLRSRGRARRWGRRRRPGLSDGHRRQLSRIGKTLVELLRDGVGIEADAGRVGADERAAKNAGRPAREVVALERLEKTGADLRICGDGRQGNLPAFTFATQAAAERLFIHHHRLHGDDTSRASLDPSQPLRLLFFRHVSVQLHVGKICAVHATAMR